MKLTNLTYGLLITLLLVSHQTATSAVNSDLELSPPPQIAAAPSRVTVDISKGRAGGSIRVFNLGEDPVNINTSVRNWTMDINNNIQVISPTRHSLDQSLIINPINFTIAPGKQQVVRYSIRPRSKPQDGEQRAMVFFNQVTDGPDNGTIGINFRMGVAIYGVAGNVQRTGKIHDFSVRQIDNSARLSIDIENLGNANVRLDGQISIWPEDYFPNPDTIPLYDLSSTTRNTPEEILTASALSALPVLPGTRRTIDTDLEVPIKPGRYMVHIVGKLGSERISTSLPLSLR